MSLVDPAIQSMSNKQKKKKSLLTVEGSTNLSLGSINIKRHKACQIPSTLPSHSKYSLSEPFLSLLFYKEQQILRYLLLPLGICTSQALMLLPFPHFSRKSLPLANETPFSLQTNLNVCQEQNSIFHFPCQTSSFHPRR